MSLPFGALLGNLARNPGQLAQLGGLGGGGGGGNAPAAPAQSPIPQGSAQEVEDYKDKLDQLNGVLQGVTGASRKLSQIGLPSAKDLGLGSIKDAMNPVNWLKAPIKAINKVIEKGMDLGMTMDALRAEMGSATGFVDHLDGAMLGVVRSSTEFGVSVEDAKEAFVGLANGVALFPTLSKANVKALGDFTVMLDKFGVNADQSAQTFDVFMSALGRSPQATQEAVRSMDVLAQQLGRTTSGIIADFGELKSELLKYGDGIDTQFAEIAKTGRRFKLSTKEIFSIANQFDTFEGAATTVGKLNSELAHYGVALNDIELMQMTESERIEHLTSQLRSAGVGFRDLGRRQKQFFAETLTGGDQDQLARLLGDPSQLEEYQNEMKTMEERGKAFTSSIEKLSASFQKFIIESGVVDATIKFLDQLAQYDLSTFTGIMKAAASIFGAKALVVKDVAASGGAHTMVPESERPYRPVHVNDYKVLPDGTLIQENKDDITAIPAGTMGGTRLNEMAFTTGRDRAELIKVISEGIATGFAQISKGSMSSSGQQGTKTMILKVGDQEFTAYVQGVAEKGINKKYNPTSTR